MVTIIAALAVPFLMVLSALIYRIGLWTRPQKEQLPEHLEPFVISEYYARTEQAALDILEQQEPVDQTIILWWGLDGLRMNEDGELEWISRKTPKPVNQNVSYQPCQSMQNANLYCGGSGGTGAGGACQAQSIQATQDSLSALRMQLAMANINMAQQQQMQNINSALQSYVVPMAGMVQTPATYPPYHYAGCCCNFLG